MIPSKSDVLGVLLAGGRARRMGGGDKCLLPFGGQPLLAHVVNRARPQVGKLILSANGNPDRFDEFGLPVVADIPLDSDDGYAGPLAGVISAMEWSTEAGLKVSWLATFATDTPFFPENMVARFLERITARNADLACATSGGRDHPVFGLWPLTLKDDLHQALVQDRIRKVSDWTARHQITRVSYADRPFDPFFNINTPEQLITAERHLAQTGTVT